MGPRNLSRRLPVVSAGDAPVAQEEARGRTLPRAGKRGQEDPARASQTRGSSGSGGCRLATVRAAALAAVLAAVVVLVAGCGAEGGGSATKGHERPGAEGTPKPSSVPQAGSETELPGPEEDEGGFAASAESSGGKLGAADRIEGVRFRILDGYERLLIDFGRRDGKPAGVPRWTTESPAQGGYVRLRFPGVSSTRVADKDLIGSVLDELYVVRGRDGGLFADAFAFHEFRYRVTEMPESGRLAVDFRGVAQELDLPPTTGDKVVVVRPREAEEVASPLSVRGYARLFEGQVTVSLLDREREVISSKTVRANDWTTAWGLFEAKLEYSGYEGLATLRVGSRSPKDGSFVGKEIEVFLR